MRTRFLATSILVASAVAFDGRVPVTAAGGTSLPSHAAPWAIVFTGSLLAHRVVVSDHTECMSLMKSASDAILIGSNELRGRPRISISMFWGPDWQYLASHPESLATLDTSRATQRGTFYPAHRGRAALWVFDPSSGVTGRTGIMTADGLTILKRHGIPTRVD
jgi:hypothetical protein